MTQPILNLVNDPPAELVVACPAYVGLMAPMRGTRDQAALARTIRCKLVRQAQQQGRYQAVNVLRSITSAGWFLTHRGKTLEDVAWPGVEAVR